MNPRTLFILSAVVFLFYLTAHLLAGDVYRHAAVGAFFELLSLPVLALLAVVPVLCVVQLFRPGRKGVRYTVGALLLIAAAVLLLVILYG